jgi:hypothetical protein
MGLELYTQSQVQAIFVTNISKHEATQSGRQVHTDVLEEPVASIFSAEVKCVGNTLPNMGMRGLSLGLCKQMESILGGDVVLHPQKAIIFKLFWGQKCTHTLTEAYPRKFHFIPAFNMPPPLLAYNSRSRPTS